MLAGVLRGNKATWQGFAVAIDEYVCDRDIVVAIGSYSGTHSLTGKSMRSVFTHVYDVVDGRIQRFRQFADTWPMVAAMQS